MSRYHACKYNRNSIYYCEFQMINCKTIACLYFGESGDETNKYSIIINFIRHLLCCATRRWWTKMASLTNAERAVISDIEARAKDRQTLPKKYIKVY